MAPLGVLLLIQELAGLDSWFKLTHGLPLPEDQFISVQIMQMALPNVTADAPGRHFLPGLTLKSEGNRKSVWPAVLVA